MASLFVFKLFFYRNKKFWKFLLKKNIYIFGMRLWFRHVEKLAVTSKIFSFFSIFHIHLRQFIFVISHKYLNN